MKTKLIYAIGLLFISIGTQTSCITSKNAIRDNSYDYYSEKLGVRLQGNENTELLKCMLAWKGAPYKYGGTSKKGTDCSGFVSSVYKEVYNKQLQRSSKDMVKDVKFVSKKELKAGDILFFKINSEKISHVGIYISDNKFIHASTKSGVVVSDLKQEYYADSFYKGGRVKI